MIKMDTVISDMFIELIYIYFLKGDPGADGPAGEMGPPVRFILFLMLWWSSTTVVSLRFEDLLINTFIKLRSFAPEGVGGT